MSKLDTLILGSVILMIIVVLLLIQSLLHPDIFGYLTKIGLFENSNNGIKNVLLSILTIAVMVIVLIVVFLIRIFMPKKS